MPERVGVFLTNLGRVDVYGVLEGLLKTKFIMLLCSALLLGCRSTPESQSALQDKQVEIPAAAINAYEYARIQALRANVAIALMMVRLNDGGNLEVVIKHLFDNDDYRRVENLYLKPSGFISQKVFGSDVTKENIPQYCAAAVLLLLTAAFDASRDLPALIGKRAAPQAVFRAFRQHGWRVYRSLYRGSSKRFAGTAIFLGLYSVASIGLSRTIADIIVAKKLGSGGLLTRQTVEGEEKIKNRFSEWARELVEEFASIYRSEQTPWGPSTRSKLQDAIEAELAKAVASSKVRLLKAASKENAVSSYEDEKRFGAVEVKDFNLIKIVEKGKFLSPGQLTNLKLQQKLFLSFGEDGVRAPFLADIRANGLVNFMAAELELLGVLKDYPELEFFDIGHTMGVLRAAQKQLVRKMKLKQPVKAERK